MWPYRATSLPRPDPPRDMPWHGVLLYTMYHLILVAKKPWHSTATFVSTNDDRKLSDPRGPLSKTIPLSFIASANSEVRSKVKSRKEANMQHPPPPPELRFEVGKRAAEHGVAATIRHYSTKFDLKESSVRTWRNVAGGVVK